MRWDSGKEICSIKETCLGGGQYQALLRGSYQIKGLDQRDQFGEKKEVEYLGWNN